MNFSQKNLPNKTQNCLSRLRTKRKEMIPKKANVKNRDRDRKGECERRECKTLTEREKALFILN